mgnify:CR=1 FL=1
MTQATLFDWFLVFCLLPFPLFIWGYAIIGCIELVKTFKQLWRGAK